MSAKLAVPGRRRTSSSATMPCGKRKEAKGTETARLRGPITLHVAKDGTLRLPARLMHEAQLGAGEELRVSVAPRRLALVGDVAADTLMAQFVRDTHRLLSEVDEHYQMADGLTVGEYLRLDDGERDALWEQAVKEAFDASEREPEQDLPADYVPAEQERRPGLVRGKG